MQESDDDEIDLYRILRRYLRKLSTKQSTPSWKRLNKKLPGLKPGFYRRKHPGELLITVDVSGSMHDTLRKYLYPIYRSINEALRQLARIFDVPSSIYYAEVSDQIHEIPREDRYGTAETAVPGIYLVKLPTEFFQERKEFVSGGGTNYQPFFETVLTSWRKVSRTSQPLPDLIIFLTDFEVNLDFLHDPLYKALDTRLIWIYFPVHRSALTPEITPPPVGQAIPYYRLRTRLSLHPA